MKARGMSRNHLKNVPSVLEDVCIKLLTAAENDQHWLGSSGQKVAIIQVL